jgi:hypothetical protein
MIETRGMLLQGGENLREESVVGREVTHRSRLHARQAHCRPRELIGQMAAENSRRPGSSQYPPQLLTRSSHQPRARNETLIQPIEYLR